MFEKKKFRILLLMTVVALLITVAAVGCWRDRAYCMGVRMISENQLEENLEFVYRDYSEYLLVNDELAAVDRNHTTIYISQDILPDTKFWDLDGTISLKKSDLQMYFLSDREWDNMADAVANNVPFTLLITNGSGEYMCYDVVFTTHPVMRMTEKNHKDGEYIGELCIWSPNDPDLGRFSVKRSDIHYHVRGATSSLLDKKPWKISLKDREGQNKNLSFLGLGADDDWILNPMNLDDTKMRELLFQNLWNEWALQNEWNRKMSAGQYVEVVHNGEYAGLHLLQRRIDAKYLNLQEADMLFKGKSTWTPNTIQEGYEIIYSNRTETESYKALQSIWDGEGSSTLHLDNFLDVSLFLQFASAADNMGYKNMFYTVDEAEGTYTISLLPWDTDMSFGLCWGSAFEYNYQRSVQEILVRKEYDLMLEEYPDLDQRLKERWKELRSGILSENQIECQVVQLSEELDNSGVMEREVYKWGLQYSEQDTVDQLLLFISERLSILDSYYQVDA